MAPPLSLDSDPRHHDPRVRHRAAPSAFPLAVLRPPLAAARPPPSRHAPTSARLPAVPWPPLARRAPTSTPAAALTRPSSSLARPPTPSSPGPHTRPTSAAARAPTDARTVRPLRSLPHTRLAPTVIARASFGQPSHARTHSCHYLTAVVRSTAPTSAPASTFGRPRPVCRYLVRTPANSSTTPVWALHDTALVCVQILNS
jgi:hypothetical protein